MEDRTSGNWGYFYPHVYKITLNVPQYINEYPSFTKYAKIPTHLEDRYDFLASVIAHEYRHAQQWIEDNSYWDDKRRLEIEAEEYERKMLDYFQEYRVNLDIPKDEAKDQKVANNKPIKWRDFR